MKLLLNLCLLSFFFCSGCATIFTKDSQQIIFDSQPEGAHIQVGPYDCVTPCSLLIPKGKSYSIEAVYTDQKKVVPLTEKMQGTTLWNILFWPGFIVDALCGKIEKYEPTEYMFHFDRPTVSGRH